MDGGSGPGGASGVLQFSSAAAYAFPLLLSNFNKGNTVEITSSKLMTGHHERERHHTAAVGLYHSHSRVSPETCGCLALLSALAHHQF